VTYLCRMQVDPALPSDSAICFSPSSHIGTPTDYTPTTINQLCVQPPTYADNVPLPAFAHRCCSRRSTSLACRAHSSKPAAAGLLWAHAGTDRRTGGRTDRRTDTVPFHRFCCACYAGSANRRLSSGRGTARRCVLVEIDMRQL